MPPHTTPIAQLRFSGEPYAGTGIDEPAMEELRKFRNILTGVARSIWRQGNNGTPPPADLEKAVLFTDFQPDEDSVTVVVSTRSGTEAEQVLRQGIESIWKTLVAAATESDPLPESMPTAHACNMSSIGNNLADEAQMQVALPDQKAAQVSEAATGRLAKTASARSNGKMGQVVGRVIEVDLENRSCQIQPDGAKQTIAVRHFDRYRKITIRRAFEQSSSLRLLVKGPAKFDADGQVAEIENAEFTKEFANGVVPELRKIWDIIEEHSKQVPAEEWKKLPSDLSARHDYYISGGEFKEK